MNLFTYIVLILIAAAVLLISWGLIEAMCLKISRSDIGESADGQEDLKILYFSDLHREFCPVSSKRVTKVISRERPDVVIFGGDICNRTDTVLPGLKYMKSVALCCRELGIPFMAVTGNHDLAPAEEIGMFPFDLMDGVIKYLKSGRDGRYIAIAGVRDTGRKERVWDSPPKPLAGTDYKAYILLSHNPDLILHLPENQRAGIDLMLSGHIHGGQIRTPFGLEFKLRHDELPTRGIISGLHEINGVKVLISTGLGCVFLPLRIGARPEINIIRFRADS